MSTSYSGKLRLRACGLLVRHEKLLLVKLKSPVTDAMVWMPPGGGVEFGENIEDALIREFQEETKLKVKVGNLLHVDELIEAGFHAVEFYFRVYNNFDKPVLGNDPEHTDEDQILEELRFFSQAEILQHETTPDFIKHNFWNLNDESGLNLSGNQPM